KEKGIKLELWDYDTIGDNDQIGSVEIPLLQYKGKKEKGNYDFIGVNKLYGQKVGNVDIECASEIVYLKGIVKVNVGSVRELPQPDAHHKPNPLVRVILGEQVNETQIIRESLNPDYNEVFTMKYDPDKDNTNEVFIEVQDIYDDQGNEKLLGGVTLNVHEYYLNQQNLQLKLIDDSNDQLEFAGQIYCSIIYEPHEFTKEEEEQYETNKNIQYEQKLQTVEVPKSQTLPDIKQQDIDQLLEQKKVQQAQLEQQQLQQQETIIKQKEDEEQIKKQKEIEDQIKKQREIEIMKIYEDEKRRIELLELKRKEEEERLKQEEQEKERQRQENNKRMEEDIRRQIEEQMKKKLEEEKKKKLEEEKKQKLEEGKMKKLEEEKKKEEELKLILLREEEKKIKKEEKKFKQEDLKYFKGQVYVLIGQLHDLALQYKMGESNLQVIATLGNQKRQSKLVVSANTSEMNQKFNIPFDPDQTKERNLFIQTSEQNFLGETDLVGTVSIPILPYLDKFTEKEFDLEVKGEDYCYKTGKINISLIYTPEQ
ncbi:MAG: hypothetical protein EZS28_036721, partial [Streblomastix strix]